jgi:hypothetical protein
MNAVGTLVRARSIARPGPDVVSRYRGDRLWPVGFIVASVSAEVLAEIDADPYIEVRRLTPAEEYVEREQLAVTARAKADELMKLAEVADAEARKLEADVGAAREASGGKRPEPEVFATPYTDSLVAAMPAGARAEMAAMQKVAEDAVQKHHAAARGDKKKP